LRTKGGIVEPMKGAASTGREEIATRGGLRFLRAIAFGGRSVAELETVLAGPLAELDLQALSLVVGGQSLERDHARRLFEALRTHRAELTARLGRPVGLRTAALDLAEALEATVPAPADLDRFSYAELLDLAFRDPLTDLHNLRYFQKRFEEEIQRARRYHHSVSVIMVDIDHFKHFNDTHGHPAGNDALIQVARVLTQESRETDLVARYGGEEFAYILPETTKRTAQDLAERVRSRVESHAIVLDNGEHHRVSVSMGLATFPRDGSASAPLIAAADGALYQAKKLGRNRFSLYVPDTHAEFVFGGEPAHTVSVVGTFNGWDKAADPLSRHEDGRWHGQVDMVPGTYEYKFVINGERWIKDPLGAETVSDGYWGENSILRLTRNSGFTGPNG
jgi:diguanylate cyclase (GGDEF)-like protein